MAFDFIAEQLAERQQQNLYRRSVKINGKQSRFINIDNKDYLNFSSNDYLGLASEQNLIEAWQKGAKLFGIGSGGSYLVTGFNEVHHDVSQQLCEWLGLDQLAFFSSGYSANQAIIKLLMSKNDLLIQDKLNHASLIEAGSQSPAKMLRFKHNQANHLKQLLEKHTNTDNKLIISEGVFSMDGDQSPITQLSEQAKENDAWLMVDDAHGLGVLGEQGKGTLVEQGLNNKDINIYMATFGKALGVGGAFVAGSKTFIEYINNFSKPYIYTTGLPPAMIYCIGEAAKIAQDEQWRRDKLSELIEQFKNLAKENAIELMPSQTAIQPVLIGDTNRALIISEKLKEQGIWTTAIRPPTVPQNKARLRITLTANHQQQDINTLVTALKHALQSYDN